MVYFLFFLSDEESWESCSNSSDEDDEDDAEDDDEEDEDNEEEGQSAEKAETTNSSSVKQPPNKTLERSIPDSDDDDDGWIDIPHSSDEEQPLAEAVAKVDPVELKSKALEIASSRVFTQEEFEAMRRYQQTKQVPFSVFCVSY